MRTEKAEGPQEPANNRKQRDAGARPRRGAPNGPIGFGTVMRDVRGPGASDGQATNIVGMPGFDPALAQARQHDAGMQAAQQMGAVATVAEQLADATHGVQDPVEALAAQDRSPTHQAQVQSHLPSPIARMTPAALLETVLDEATKLEIEAASKELHVELEPEDLGPLIVRLRKGPDGTLDIDFRARQGDAARMLESGSELLRERLALAGHASVAIDVQHDEELRLGNFG